MMTKYMGNRDKASIELLLQNFYLLEEKNLPCEICIFNILLNISKNTYIYIFEQINKLKNNYIIFLI